MFIRKQNMRVRQWGTHIVFWKSKSITDYSRTYLMIKIGTGEPLACLEIVCVDILSFNLFIWAPCNFIFRIDNRGVLIDWILPEALGCRCLRTIVQPSISSGFMSILFSRMFPWLPSTSHNFRKLPRILRQVHWRAGGRLGGIGLTMMGLSCSCPRETISLLQSCKSHVCRPNNNHLYASKLSILI